MSKINGYNVEEFISEEKIKTRISELGKEITQVYRGIDSPLILLGVLKGSIIFLADLCRAIDLPVELEMIGLSSYGEATKSSGFVRITQDLSKPIENRHVLIVEDIFDTGLTLKYLIENLQTRSPKSVKVCTLLNKEVNKQKNVTIDFLGFNIADEFVVGYGLDIAEQLRHLPMIAKIS